MLLKTGPKTDNKKLKMRGYLYLFPRGEKKTRGYNSVESVGFQTITLLFTGDTCEFNRHNHVPVIPVLMDTWREPVH